MMRKKLGALVYKLLFKRTHYIRYSIGHFGFAGHFAFKRGEATMKKEAVREQPIRLSTDPKHILISYLTGQNYWYQTIYAIKSLHKQMGENFRVDIYSDGSLTDNIVSNLKKFCPDINIISERNVISYLDKYLPANKYPTLRFLRDWHPFFRRLTDIHSFRGWSLHLDSDMLFFGHPDELVDAFEKKQAIYMKEGLAGSYFVEDVNILKEKYEMTCIPLVNGGIIAFDGYLIDYDDLEFKARILMESYKYQGAAKIEQTLISYILSQQNAVGLDQNKYRIFYDLEIETTPEQVLRHYIFKAKLPFFTSEWKVFHL